MKARSKTERKKLIESRFWRENVWSRKRKVLMGAYGYGELADYLNRNQGTRKRAGTDLDRGTWHTQRNAASNNLGKQKQGDQPVKAICCKGGLGTAQRRRLGRDGGKEMQRTTKICSWDQSCTSYIQNCPRCYGCLKIGFLVVLLICR